jgi:hypothetical protein
MERTAKLLHSDCIIEVSKRNIQALFTMHITFHNLTIIPRLILAPVTRTFGYCGALPIARFARNIQCVFVLDVLVIIASKRSCIFETLPYLYGHLLMVVFFFVCTKNKESTYSITTIKLSTTYPRAFRGICTFFEFKGGIAD